MPGKKIILKAVLFGVLVSLVISVILLCVLTIAEMTTGLLPVEIVNIACAVVLAVGTFVGGFAAARITKSAGLIVGAITGLSVFMVVLISGLIRSGDEISALTLIKLGLELISGTLGGIIGVNKKEKLHIK